MPQTRLAGATLWGRVDLRLGVVGPSSLGSTKHRRSRLAQAQIYLGRGHVGYSDRLLPFGYLQRR
jgi:hypothetical protein